MESNHKITSSGFSFYLFQLLHHKFPSRCYTREIRLKMASVLKDSRVLEICSSKRCVGQFFQIRALLRVKEPNRCCIIIEILGTGWVRASIQWERLPIFCYYFGRIGQIFPQSDILKNSPFGSRLSQGNYPYPDTLGVIDKTQPEFSFYMKLHSSIAEVPLPIVGGSSKISSITKHSFSV